MPGCTIESEPRGRMLARLNPCATDRLEKLTFQFPAGQNWEERLEALRSNSYRGAIVGPQGTGKTALLFELQAKLERLGCKTWLRRPPPDRTGQSRMVKDALNQSPTTLLLIDSAERLSRWKWWHLRIATARRRQGLIVTLHRRRTLPTWVHTSTDLPLFNNLLTQLGLDINHPEIEARARQAFAAHRGNLRAALLSLYDAFASGEIDPSGQ